MNNKSICTWIALIIVIIILAVYLCVPNRWFHTEPKQRLSETIVKYGKPTAIINARGGMAYWHKPSLKPSLKHTSKSYNYPDTCYEWLMIKDEDIPHTYPVAHSDFFYGSVVIDIPDDKLLDVLLISKSMWYDRLTKQLIARCHFEEAIVGSLLLGVRVAKGTLTLEAIERDDLYKKYMAWDKQLNIYSVLVTLCHELGMYN